MATTNSDRADVYLALGANLGERRKSVRRALDAIDDLPDTDVVSVSEFYETKARFVEEQPDFINACTHITTGLDPRELLAALLEIERDMGRERVIRRGPRIIDLDILFYDDRIIDEEGLTIPHLDLHNRYFVLKPLADIAPHLEHPAIGQSVRQMLSVHQT